MPRRTPPASSTPPRVTAATLMAMPDPPARPGRPPGAKARAGLEARIAAELDRLQAIHGTRRQGAIVIQGRSRDALLPEAVRRVAPGWSYTVEAARVVLGERKR
jgi:hypothetical protein